MLEININRGDVMYTLLNILIYVNRRKLERMISSNLDSAKILKQSQKLDVLVVKKFKKMNNGKKDL